MAGTVIPDTDDRYVAKLAVVMEIFRRRLRIYKGRHTSDNIDEAFRDAYKVVDQTVQFGGDTEV